MILKEGGTYCRMEVSGKYRANYMSWIIQLTLSLSVWLHTLLFCFLTCLVPRFYYHWLFPSAERALALVGKSIVARTKMNLHGTLPFTSSTFPGQSVLTAVPFLSTFPGSYYFQTLFTASLRRGIQSPWLLQ